MFVGNSFRLSRDRRSFRFGRYEIVLSNQWIKRHGRKHIDSHKIFHIPPRGIEGRIVPAGDGRYVIVPDEKWKIYAFSTYTTPGGMEVTTKSRSARFLTNLTTSHGIWEEWWGIEAIMNVPVDELPIEVRVKPVQPRNGVGMYILVFAADKVEEFTKNEATADIIEELF